ncbi:hypothetical protein K469DRAFT_748273 [Zopfia rhizophila CBS 207.26]|uniref:Uncharacterized protein n=1 Tax=Zopfia rhizophila CBS 207.26 TaxID=1314779 RepID=A0A6A6EG54_9PEZI|nr:hypothetical protein K469DRAFT_748273 [Zopfia rhizophila CBS 207.26]
MGDDGGSQPHRHGCENRDRDASGGSQQASGQHQEKDKRQPDQDWQKAIETLQKVEDDLNKEEEEKPRRGILADVKKALRRVQNLWASHRATHDNKDKTQLDRIEAGIKELKNGTSVAAQASHTVNAAAAPLRTTIRIRFEES